MTNHNTPYDLVDRLRRNFVSQRNQWDAADEIERLLKERDEARREVCKDEAIIRLQRNRVPRGSEEVVRMAKEIYVERGWEYLKEKTNER
ncbi:hypothetical protein FJZ55_09730 [Candidatus Woesearchaeota archaeon]|nr:hypothetical protein [Candidatus Woesearchaeota archaeon]